MRYRLASALVLAATTGAWGCSSGNSSGADAGGPRAREEPNRGGLQQRWDLQRRREQQRRSQQRWNGELR